MRLAFILLASAACAFAEPPKTSSKPEPRAPVAGQPFDDREILSHFEREGRKLFTEGRIKPIKTAPRRCAMPLASTRGVKSPLAEVAGRAESATVVLGEFFKDGKKKGVDFSSAAGGFFVGEKGMLVTSLHVVSDKESRGFVAMTRDGRVFPVREALAVDPVDDVVVLQLDVPDDVTFPTLPLAVDPAPIGTNIAVMSHPDEHFWLLTTGHVARQTMWRGDHGVEHYTCITADFAKGSSGCPVVDDSGNVIGVVNNTQSVYYDDDGRKKQLDLQMVVKNTTPSWVVREMFNADAASAAVATPPPPR
jgi:S1-C subfamily serine protease